MEKRTLHRGDIFLNRWAGWQTLFVYFRTSGRFCYGVSITKVFGKYKVESAQYYKEDISYDTEYFPLIGNININDMWLNAVFGGITDMERLSEYDEEGHRKHDDTNTET